MGAVNLGGFIYTDHGGVLVSMSHKHHDVLQRPLACAVRNRPVEARGRGGAAVLVQGGQSCGALSAGRISTGFIGEWHIGYAFVEGLQQQYGEECGWSHGGVSV